LAWCGLGDEHLVVPLAIPADHWKGEHTLDWELPWLTPYSIFVLNQILDADDRVLEFGSGGSTLFFARRCATVLSFETAGDWADSVRTRLEAAGLANVELHAVSVLADCAPFVSGRSFNVALVDCNPNHIRRLDALLYALPYLDADSIVILDNYDSATLKRVDPAIFHGWHVSTLDDPHWVGRGTRIFSRIPRSGFIPVDDRLHIRAVVWLRWSVPHWVWHIRRWLGPVKRALQRRLGLRETRR
jgi:hypothetical protein